MTIIELLFLVIILLLKLCQNFKLWQSLILNYFGKFKGALSVVLE